MRRTSSVNIRIIPNYSGVYLYDPEIPALSLLSATYLSP